MKVSSILTIIISVVVYSFILGICGCFGTTISNGLFYFVKNILPIIGIVLGYFFVIFIPIRVFQAKSKNKEELEAYVKDLKLNEYSAAQKEEAENIRKILNNGDRV